MYVLHCNVINNNTSCVRFNVDLKYRLLDEMYQMIGFGIKIIKINMCNDIKKVDDDDDDNDK